jgi:hypothetical protein
MDLRRIPTEDYAGLSLAIAAHVALVAWLVYVPRPEPVPMPERVTVTLSGEIGEQASAPSREAAAAAIGPVLSQDPVPEPAASPIVQPPSQPQTRSAPQPLTKPALQTQPPRPQNRVGSDFLKGLPPGKPAPRGGGASRIGDDFLKGVLTSDHGKGLTASAPKLSAQQLASLRMEVMRQLKPHWQAPDGIDIEKLATIVDWHLNVDGTLADTPRCLSHSGETAANRAQVMRHCEQAKKAVRMTRFSLPAEKYSDWSHLQFEFNRKLGQ